MGIEARYRHPRTTKPELGHKIYPYLLRGTGDTSCPVLAAVDHDGAAFFVETLEDPVSVSGCLVPLSPAVVSFGSSTFRGTGRR
jgi:hypothetical protein